MVKWLVLAAIPALVASGAASAQSNGSLVAGQAASRALDLRLMQEASPGRPAPLIRRMLFRQNVAPNAALGIGLANIYARRKGSADWRLGQPAPHSRKPAVTFVVKF